MLAKSPGDLTPDIVDQITAFTFIDILMDGSVLDSAEYSCLTAMRNTGTAVDMSRYLLDCIGHKSKALRQRFVKLLARSQPNLRLQQVQDIASQLNCVLSDDFVHSILHGGQQGRNTSATHVASDDTERQPVKTTSLVQATLSGRDQGGASGSHSRRTDTTAAASGHHQSSSLSAAEGDIGAAATGPGLPDTYDNVSASTSATFIDWVRLLETVSSVVLSEGTCISLATQLGMLCHVDDDIMPHLLVRYPNDYPSMAAHLFRMWLCMPATLGLNDKQKKNFLHEVFTLRMGHPELTSALKRSLATPEYCILSSPSEVLVQATLSGSDQGGASGSHSRRTDTTDAASGHRHSSSLSAAEGDIGAAATGPGLPDTYDNVSASTSATFIDWVRLLETVSSVVLSEGTCISLATQLGMLCHVDDDIMPHLLVRYPNDYPSMAAHLFRMWLGMAATLQLNDKEKRNFLHEVFTLRIRHPELTSALESSLATPEYYILEQPSEVFLPDLHRPRSRHIDEITPVVRKYFETLVKEAEKMSKVNMIDYYGVDTTECVDDVYVCVTSLSYNLAWKLLKQQGKGDVKELARLARRPISDESDGAELHNLELLLVREEDNSPIYRTLVLGGAGSGKTVLCSKIAYDWKSRKSFKKFIACIYIAGRDSIRMLAETTRQFLALPERLTDLECQEIISFLADHAKSVLFLIDGGDEIGGRGPVHEGKILRDLLCEEGPFAKATVILTSRPSEVPFAVLKTCKIQRSFSLIGLKGKRLMELACQRLGNERALRFAQSLWEPGREQIKSAAQETPLFAAMLIRIFAEEATLPHSMTGLYSHMLNNAVQRLVARNTRRRNFQLAHSQGNTSTTVQLVDEASNRNQLFSGVEGLEKLALENLMHQRFTFTSNVVAQFPGTEEVGFLTTMADPGSQMGQKVYAFCHLSWQQYLAARELAKSTAFSTSLRKALEKIGCEEHTWLFWRFVASLIPHTLLLELIITLSISLRVHDKSAYGDQRIFFLLTCLLEQQKLPSSSQISLAASWLFSSKTGQMSGYQPNPYECAALAFVLGRSPQVGGLHLSQCRLDEQRLKILAPAMCHLSSMHIHDNNISGDRLSCIAQSINQSPTRLQSILFTQCQLQDADAVALSTIVNGCPCLEKISFARNQLRPVGVLTFLAKLKEGSGCETVDFSYNNLDGLDGTACGKELSKLTHIRSLDLSNCNLVDANLGELLHQLRSNKHLKFLICNSNALTAAILPIIGKFMSASHSEHAADRLLTGAGNVGDLQFYLHGNQISHIDIQHAVHRNLFPGTFLGSVFCGTMRVHNGRLATVDIVKVLAEDDQPDFFDWGIGDDFAEQVATLLIDSAAAEVTTSVEFGQNKIGDKGVTAIATCLSNNSTLQALSLHTNLIGPAGGNALAGSLSMQKNTSLVFLNLSRNNIFAMDLSSQKCFEMLVCECNSLKVLLLEGTGLSAYHCERISRSSHLGATLAMLSLRDNSVGDAGAVPPRCTARHQPNASLPVSE